MKKMIYLVIAFVFIYYGWPHLNYLIHAPLFTTPQMNPNASLLEQAQAASRAYLGKKDLNDQWMKSFFISLVLIGGAIVLTLISFTSRNVYSKSRENAEYSSNNVIDFSQYHNPVIAFDTNVLIKEPDVLPHACKKAEVVISKQVIKELNKLKTEEDTKKKALEAFYYIDQLSGEGKIKIVAPESDIFSKYDLDDTDPDQVIIASYVTQKELHHKTVVYFSYDRGAKIYAREAGLIVKDLPQSKQNA